MFQNLLVPIDGSELSRRAVRAAVALAADVRARVTFFHALPDMESSLYGEAALMRAVAPGALEQAIDERASAILADAERIANDAGVANARAHSVADHPYEAIIAAAAKHGCDLVVMASHGYRGLKGVLLGSQTQQVLTHSSIPVLVYR